MLHLKTVLHLQDMQHINDEHAETAENLDIIMPMYNLIEYSDNYADTYAGGDNANNRETTFQITSTKLYVPVVTLSTKEIVNLTKQLNEGFKGSVYWNKYQSKLETKTADNNNITSFPLDASFHSVKRSFVLAFDNTNNNGSRVERDSHRNYFLPRVNITGYNVLTDGRNFYDQLINDQIKKYDEIRKKSTRNGEDYTTGYLLDYQYFKDHYQLIANGLSKGYSTN